MQCETDMTPVLDERTAVLPVHETEKFGNNRNIVQ
jgi:hypothetical protein